MPRPDHDDLKKRLEHDENMFLKIQESANRQHMDSLNQIADLCALVNRLISRLDKQDRRIEALELKLERK